MFKKVKEIAEAWIIAANPSQSQIILAEARLKICNDCKKITYRELTGNPLCGECGCPLKKKIFSSKYDACPLHKWLEVEDTDIFKDTQKKSKSFL
jgi:hypothetical protein